ncbi:hypothetical protein PGT21_030450 [Puccinia graminis f. sp. tritici]|uniref:Uncharacterized protein n=1 Tax=Puccinia graminis f. sp. tritici TaxID=56615 RepID=A0A5B0PLQ9_PUCGR|nr:hypothetical protein PGT21_030450 [Puccinia graminis f. sp. tritici]
MRERKPKPSKTNHPCDIQHKYYYNINTNSKISAHYLIGQNFCSRTCLCTESNSQQNGLKNPLPGTWSPRTPQIFLLSIRNSDSVML